MILAYASGKFYQHHPITPLSAIGSLLFFENRNTVVGVGWTLNYEMYFYLVFAASLLLFRSAKFALPFVSFVIILNVLFIGKLASSDFLRNPIALEFLAGMALASMFKTLRPSHLAAILMTCIAAASIYLASALTNSPDTGGLGRDRRWLAWGLPAAILVLAAIFQAKHPSRAGRFLLLLGDSSYALYLTHSIVMTIYAWALLHGMWKAVPMWVIIPSVLAFCVLLAIFVHKTIERPIHVLLSRAWFKTNQRRSNTEIPAPAFQAAL